MIDPRIIIKANYNRTLVTIRVTAIDSPDWVDIVGTRIELSRNPNFSPTFVYSSTSHYKIRTYLENPTPNQTIYGRVTLTKNDNTTLVKTFNFVTPYPVLGTVKDEDGTQYIASMRKMDKNGNLSSRDYTNKVAADQAAYIDIVADEAGEMIVGNQWTTPILAQNVTQGLAEVEIVQNASTTIAVNNGDVVRVKEGTENVTFRTFSSTSNPLCKGVSAHISVMPMMDKFTTNTQGTRVSPYFFYSFNCNGTLTSLPEGSFDIHKITGDGNTSHEHCFESFNDSGALTSLPEGSFDTYQFISQAATSSGGSVPTFNYFNRLGALTSLPEGSFDFDNWYYCAVFRGFNYNGALTSLPEGSFGFSRFTPRYNIPSNFPTYMFDDFNRYGRLTTLPAGAFHFKEGTVFNARWSFGRFNCYGSLTSLPEHSFNQIFGDGSLNMAFTQFNKNGALTSLPEGSFVMNPNLTSLDSSVCQEFNANGSLTSLPEGSFKFDNVTRIPFWGFKQFNYNGALISLPEGSFNFDSVTSISGQDALAQFNGNGALKTLPRGSFSFKNLTSLSSSGFAWRFNYGGQLEYLPIGAFCSDLLGTQPVGRDGFGGFNAGDGRLRESATDYNPRFVNISYQAIPAYYYDSDSQTSYSNSIGLLAPFKYYQADYFNVVYTESQAYTTDLASEYLSGQTITFSASAIDPEYMVTPTITTDGGTTVTVTDNGDDTYTFVMPQDNITVNITVGQRPAVITLTAEEAGTMVVVNKWTTPVLVKNITQNTPAVTVSGGSSTNVTVAIDDEVTVTEGSANVTFRNWFNLFVGICRGVLARVSSMPDMNRFTTNISGTNVGDYFFQGFCAGDNNKGVTSLPAGSFDISNITNITSAFFNRFNYQGLLTSLPSGSFGINSNLISLPSGFCKSFNEKGKLTSLPANSFKLDNITSIGNNAFENFNRQGKLTSLPTDSFITTNVTTLGHDVFAWFNYRGELTSLPNRSFDLIGLTSIPNMCFCGFNNGGKLVALGAGSFRTDNLVTVGSDCFEGFNQGGELSSLPTDSFKLDNVTSIGTYGFASFNYSGKLTTLPVGSFGFGNLITAGGYMFQHFNQQGQLISLPAGSFNFDNLTTVGVRFCDQFNDTGALTSLPTGSFGTTSLTSVGTNFYDNFNHLGHIEKDTVNYNPNCVNPYTSGTIDVHYWNGSATTTESVAAGAPFYFKTS